MRKYNLGGMLEEMMVPVELEGGEAFETPDGNLFEVEGPKHAKGGVKAQLPEGTQVYSDSIKGPDGKSLADRKKKRTKSIKQILKEKDDPFNSIVRNTLERTLQWATEEELADQVVMELANELDSVMKWGGKVKKYEKGGRVKKQLGGPVLGDILAQLLAQRARESAPVEQIPTGYDNMVQGRMDSAPTIEGITPNPVSTTAESPSPTTPLLDSIFRSFAGPGGESGGMGDIVGGAVKGGIAAGPLGAAIGTFGPLVTTLMNGIGGKNQNPYEGYGQAALGSNEQAQRTVEGARDQAVSDNSLAFQDQTAGIRSGTSSASVARAATQGAVANRMRQDNRATVGFADRLSRLLSERARMQLGIDERVMGGADTATVRDTQDRDNFFTNINSDIRNVAKGLMFQESVSEAPDILKLLGLNG